jgi:hypothetical protein
MYTKCLHGSHLLKLQFYIKQDLKFRYVSKRCYHATFHKIASRPPKKKGVCHFVFLFTAEILKFTLFGPEVRTVHDKDW